MIHGQSVESLNKQIPFYEQLEKSVDRSTDCLKSIYNKFLNYKENQKGIISYSNVKCIPQPEDYHYKNALGAGNKSIQQSWILYNQLYSLNMDLISYIRLEEYQSDGVAGGLKMIGAMEDIVFDLIKNRSGTRNMEIMLTLLRKMSTPF